MLHHIRAVVPTDTNRRAVLGLVVGIVSLVTMNAAVFSGGLWVLAFIPAGFAFIFGSWLINPWFRALPEQGQFRITGLPLAVYAVWVGGLLFCVALTITADGVGASVLLVGLWAVHSAYANSFEPSEFALRRTRRRLGRGVHLRVLTLWCGLLGVLRLAWALADAGGDRYKVFLAGGTLTLALGGVAASLKVYSRFRKLCTGLHRQIQRLMRSLEELREAEVGAEQLKAQQVARRSWDELEEYLLTRVDTGFSFVGVCVLPEKAIEELKQQVMASLAAPSEEAERKKAADDLRLLQEACRGRIDAVA